VTRYPPNTVFEYYQGNKIKNYKMGGIFSVHVIYVRYIRNSVQKSEGTMHLGDPKADEEKILKWILDYEVED
jgi:hypothetical protein